MHDHTAGLTDGVVAGRIALQPGPRPAEGRAVQGAFTGRLDKKEVTLKLDGIPRLGKAVSADPEREIDVDVVDASEPPQAIGHLHGDFPRRSWDRLEKLRPTISTTSTCTANSENSMSWR